MREAEVYRNKRKVKYTRYKNNYFIELIKEATTILYWTTWDITRIKNLRNILETDYDIPINFFSAFVYYTTYNYMKWQHRKLSFDNYVGFISNENVLVSFGNFIAKKGIVWREKNSRYPVDWELKWGIKNSIKGQKLGRKDKHVKEDIFSETVGKKINRYL